VEHYYDLLTPQVKESYPGELLKKKIQLLHNINVGGFAFDIELPTPDGTIIKLSSLRGKYVLLDFWASWCRPCLAEAPNVKEIYEKYHEKGFEVYGVSLDEKKDLWEDAILKHGLNWQHVSSLKGWKCPVAAQYNVTGIPKTFLIDPEGRILAVDLRGKELKDKVASLFDVQSPLAIH
jgi:peroxiredoxin